MGLRPVANEAGAGVPAGPTAALAEIQGVFGLGLYDYTTPTVEQILGRAPQSLKQWIAKHKSAFSVAGS